jgi:hypothetical protein
MLVSSQPHGVRTHAAFQAQRLVDGENLDGLELVEVDLDAPPALPDAPPPF